MFVGSVLMHLRWLLGRHVFRISPHELLCLRLIAVLAILVHKLLRNRGALLRFLAPDLCSSPYSSPTSTRVADPVLMKHAARVPPFGGAKKPLCGAM
jgi:hypothetical protein